MINTFKKAAALAMLSLVVGGCGGVEELSPQETPEAQESAWSRLQRLPRLEAPRSEQDEKTAYAQLFNPYYHEVVWVCCTVIDGESYVLNVEGVDDTYYDVNGLSEVWTRERYGDGSYFASFASSSVYWDDIYSEYQNGVFTVWRHYTLQNVTSGSFFSQIMSTNGNFYWDTVYIR